MKVLMISLDASVLEPESGSFRRMKDYSSICDELHIIILGAPGNEYKDGNIFVYPTAGNRPLSLFSAYKTGKKILKNNGWIITSQDPFEAGFIAWRLSKKFCLPLEIQLHGDFYGNSYWRKERWLNRARFYLGKFILKRADSVRAVSERIKKSISSDKIFVLPIYSDFVETAKDPNFLKEKFSGAYPIMLAAGNLVPVKNHKFLIEVFAAVKKELPQAKLVIAGDGPLLENFKFQISNFKLEQDIWLAGHQNNLADFYSSADIFIHPSLYEGWGRAVAEAAQFGLPIIMSDVGLAGEVIKNNESGLVVPVNNAMALTGVIIKLAQDGELRENLKNGAKHAAESFLTKEQFLVKIEESWEAVSK